MCVCTTYIKCICVYSKRVPSSSSLKIKDIELTLKYCCIIWKYLKVDISYSEIHLIGLSQTIEKNFDQWLKHELSILFCKSR